MTSDTVSMRRLDFRRLEVTRVVERKQAIRLIQNTPGHANVDRFAARRERPRVMPGQERDYACSLLTSNIFGRGFDSAASDYESALRIGNYCPSGPLTVPMNPVLLSSTARRSWLRPCGIFRSIGTIMPLSKIC